MSLFNKFKKIFTKTSPPSFKPEDLSKEVQSLIQSQGPSAPPLQQIQEHLELERIKDSKKLLQRLDELITSAEAEIEILVLDLHKTSQEENQLKIQIKAANEPGSWLERNFLLRLERILLQKNNSQQRLEIYNQNIRIYMNLIARIQDMVAMKMDGISENKIENTWLDFKENLEQYKERVLCGEVSDEEITPITSTNLEKRLHELRNEVFGTHEPYTEILEEKNLASPEKKQSSEKQEPPKAEEPLLE